MDNLVATLSSVGALLSAVAIGAVSAEYVPSRPKTLKDFSFVISSVMLPCLLFRHLAEAFTPHAMLSTIVFPLAAIGGMAIGYFVGLLYCKLLLSEDAAHVQYHTIAKLCCIFQNTVVIPLSLLTTVYTTRTVEWFDLSLYEDCVAYTFIYTVPVAISFWSVGYFIVAEGAKKERQKENAEAGTGEPVAIETATGSEPTTGDQHGEGEGKRSPHHTSHHHHHRRQLHQQSLLAACFGRIEGSLQRVVRSTWNPPFICSLLGMALGLNPWLLEDIKEKLSVPWDAICVIGRGSIPCALLLLGGNLANAGLDVASSSAKGTEPCPEKASVPPSPITSGPAARCTGEAKGSDTARSSRADGEAADDESRESFSSSGSSESLIDGNGPPSLVNCSFSSIDAQVLTQEEPPAAPTSTTPRDSEQPSAGAKTTRTSQEQHQGETHRSPVLSASSHLHKPTSSPFQRLRCARVVLGIERRLKLLFARNGIPKRILLLLPIVRLIVVPAVGVSIFHFFLRRFVGLEFVQGFDADGYPFFEDERQRNRYRTVWMVLITELTAPSAINTTVLCTLHGYMPGTASKIIFYQYTMCILTMVGWLMFTLWYVSMF